LYFVLLSFIVNPGLNAAALGYVVTYYNVVTDPYRLYIKQYCGQCIHHLVPSLFLFWILQSNALGYSLCHL